jgi:hypothetical protein
VAYFEIRNPACYSSPFKVDAKLKNLTQNKTKLVICYDDRHEVSVASGTHIIAV